MTEESRIWFRISDFLAYEDVLEVMKRISAFESCFLNTGDSIRYYLKMVTFPDFIKEFPCPVYEYAVFSEKPCIFITCLGAVCIITDSVEEKLESQWLKLLKSDFSFFIHVPALSVSLMVNGEEILRYPEFVEKSGKGYFLRLSEII